jgi:LPS sulfotransferase NodH
MQDTARKSESWDKLGSARDLADIELPLASYFVCTTARTGSTLFCWALGSTRVAGTPAEYFFTPGVGQFVTQWGLRDPTFSQYLHEVIARTTSKNGIFGAKIMYPHFVELLNLLRALIGTQDPDPLHVIGAVFPNPQFIFLTRRDKVRQAISITKAFQTSIWNVPKDRPVEPSREPYYSTEEIDRYLTKHVLEFEARWEAFFLDNDISPIRVTYEDFVHAYGRTILNSVSELGIALQADIAFADPPLRRLADATNERWLAEYLHAKGWIAKSLLHHRLEQLSPSRGVRSTSKGGEEDIRGEYRRLLHDPTWVRDNLPWHVIVKALSYKMARFIRYLLLSIRDAGDER